MTDSCNLRLEVIMAVNTAHNLRNVAGQQCQTSTPMQCSAMHLDMTQRPGVDIMAWCDHACVRFGLGRLQHKNRCT